MVSESLEHRPFTDDVSQIDGADRAIFEGQSDDISIEDLNRRNSGKRVHNADLTPSRQRLDPSEPITAARTFPVVHQFLSMHIRPLFQQAQAARGEGAGQYVETLDVD